MHDNPKDELKQIAPGLGDLKRDDGFTVPHNYFKELPDRVLDRIHADAVQPSAFERWRALFWKPRYALAFATVLALIVAGVWISKPGAAQDPLADITQEEALQYVMANLHEYSTEDVMALSSDQTWSADELIHVSDENMDELIDEILESGDDVYIEDLF